MSRYYRQLICNAELLKYDCRISHGRQVTITTHDYTDLRPISLQVVHIVPDAQYVKLTLSE